MAEPLTKTGQYQIIRELGRGSMGVVYQGFDPAIGRPVAIKTMLVEGLPPSEFEEYKARFQREARAAGILSHPNIVTVYAFGEDNGVLYLAMEFLEGRSLQDLVDKKELLPIETIIPMYDQICSALDHAHANKIVHRDIKPANIMILDTGVVKVTDFGIAKMLSMGMTQAGQILGTPNYMSPEQVKGKQVDGRSDIFSLGVILYELITGEKPFGGQNITTVIYKIINENPIPPRELDATIHPGLSYVIQKSLAKSIDERYQTCRELAEDLRNYKNLGSATAPSATVVIRVPPIQTQPAPPVQPPPVQAATPPPPVAEPSREPAPPPPAPRPAKPVVSAPVVSAARRPEKHTSPVVWIALTLVFAALVAGGWYFVAGPGKSGGTSSSVTTNTPTTTNPATEPTSSNPTNATSQPASTSNATTTPPTTKPATSPTTAANPPEVKHEPPPQSTPTAARTGKLSIASNVKGASITVDGQPTRWTTPHTLELPAGEHTIALDKDGYKPGQDTVTVQGGRAFTKKIELAAMEAPVTPPPKPPDQTPAAAGGQGTVEVTTTPPGLDVLIDGKSIGPSPAHTSVSGGEEHSYSVTCPDAEPNTWKFKVKPGSGVLKTVTCSHN